jgi:hypothetical protein
LRSTFDNSRLVRLLGGWAPAEGEPSGMDFAERLSLWFNAFDAIRLQAVHQSLRSDDAAARARPARTPRAGAGALAEEVQRVRAILARAIAQDPMADSPDTGYAAYRRRHAELQGRMELMIAPLRDHVRQALAAASPRLRQLAALDAVLEQVLATREQTLLPTVAIQLERRFRQLQLAHERALEPAGEPDEAAAPQRPGSWQPLFEQDWRDALLAELDLRLEPVTGLVEALTNESNLQQ